MSNNLLFTTTCTRQSQKHHPYQLLSFTSVLILMDIPVFLFIFLLAKQSHAYSSPLLSRWWFPLGYHINFNTRPASCSKSCLKGCAGEVWEKNKIKKDVGETEEEQNRFKYFNGFAFVHPGKRFVPPPQTFKHLSRFGNMNAGRRSYSTFQEIELIVDQDIEIVPRTYPIYYMNDVNLKYFTGFEFHSFGKTLLTDSDVSKHNQKNQAKIRSKSMSIYIN